MSPAPPQETEPRLTGAGRRRALGQILVSTGLLAFWLALTDRLSSVCWLAPHLGALVALGFLGLPWLTEHLLPLPTPWTLTDRLGLAGPLRRGVGLGLLASLCILPLFSIGFFLLETQFLHSNLGAGPGMQGPPLTFQQPSVASNHHVIVEEMGKGLVVTNATAYAIAVLPQGRPAIAVPAGARRSLDRQILQGFRLQLPSGQPLPEPALAASGEALSQPVEVPWDWQWLLPFALAQFLAIALPEEAFFRGFILARLRQLWPARRRLLGVPFGVAHVASAALFALIHLVAVPEPARLLVFFPALLFAWLAERSRAVWASAVHHALSNIALRVLQRFFA